MTWGRCLRPLLVTWSHVLQQNFCHGCDWPICVFSMALVILGSSGGKKLHWEDSIQKTICEPAGERILTILGLFCYKGRNTRHSLAPVNSGCRTKVLRHDIFSLPRCCIAPSDTERIRLVLFVLVRATPLPPTPTRHPLVSWDSTSSSHFTNIPPCASYVLLHIMLLCPSTLPPTAKPTTTATTTTSRSC